MPTLITRARALRRPEWRLELASTAAYVARRAGPTQEGAAIDAIEEEYGKPDVPVRARVHSLDALATLGSSAAIRLMWKLASNASYLEEWRLVERLSERPLAGYSAMRDHLCELLDRARGSPDNSLPEDLEEPCKAAAKLLPTLTERLVRDGDAHAEEAVALLQNLSDRLDDWLSWKLGYGIEASLAQGFKHAFWERTCDALDDQVVALATGATFWYARAMAVHALALRAANPETDSGRTARLLADLGRATTDRHAFVAEIARLCMRGVSHGDIGRYVWKDESTVVARSGQGVAPGTARLLGKLILELNMNAQEDGDRPERLKQSQLKVAVSPDVPECLTNPRAAERILGKRGADPCPGTCGFHLCPYGPERARAKAFRGDLSAAFCRAQRQNAPALERLRFFGRSPTAAFWRDMEKRAADRG